MAADLLQCRIFGGWYKVSGGWSRVTDRGEIHNKHSLIEHLLVFVLLLKTAFY